MQNFKQLRVWHEAQDVTVEVYRITGGFPREELFGLTVQMRRAVMSIGANIAEGSKRSSARDKAHFLNIAQGSTGEVTSELEVARRLEYVSAATAGHLEDRFDHIAAMLERLRQQVLLKATPRRGGRPAADGQRRTANG